MAIVNITCWNDSDFLRGFAFMTTDTLTPINLTGNTMRMGIRRNASDIDEELLLTTENGGINIVDGPNGKFTVHITQAQLEQLSLGNYEHSLIRMKGPTTLRIWSGTLVNNAGASRGD